MNDSLTDEQQLERKKKTYIIPAPELRAHLDPLDGKMWQVDPISEAEVLAAKQDGQVERRSWNEIQKTNPPRENHRIIHIQRIAFLIDQPVDGDLIMMLSNHTNVIEATLNDGNHRVAAAYLRGDASLSVVISASDQDNILSVFSGALPQYPDLQ